MILWFSTTFAAVSVVTVALLEFVKELFQLRRRYHVKQLSTLFDETDLIEKMVEVAAAGNQTALCSQHADQFVLTLAIGAHTVNHYAVARLEAGPMQPEALALYAKLGYEDRGPFGPYKPDPLSVFMEKAL